MRTFRREAALAASLTLVALTVSGSPGPAFADVSHYDLRSLAAAPQDVEARGASPTVAEPGKEAPPEGTSRSRSTDAEWDSLWKKYNSGKYDEVIADCTAMIEKDAKDSDAYGMRGYALLQKKDWVKAAADAYAALSMGSQWSLPRRILAQTDYQLASYASGAAHAGQALALGTTFKADSYAFKGYCEYYTKDYEAALADLSKAIDLSKDFWYAHWMRFWTNRDLGIRGSALADAETLVRLKPGDGDSQRALGRAQEDLGAKDKAIAAYQQAKQAYETAGNTDWAKKMADAIEKLKGQTAAK